MGGHYTSFLTQGAGSGGSALQAPAGRSCWRACGRLGHRCGGKVLFCVASGQDVFPLGGSSLRNSDLPVTYYLLIGCVPMANLVAVETRLKEPHANVDTQALRNCSTGPSAHIIPEQYYPWDYAAQDFQQHNSLLL
jgi:hypothetical protein